MFDSNMSFGNAVKLSLSTMLFVGLIIRTVSILHDQNICVNKISMLPYYSVIFQSMAMMGSYISYAFFATEDLDPEE